MTCPYCESNNLEYVPAFSGTSDEPASDPFYECLGCGAAIDDDFDEGSLGDYQMELMEGVAA